MTDIPQRENDKYFMQNLTSNNTQVVEEGHEDRKNEVIAILNLVLARGGRRGAPTKQNLIHLCQLCPGQPVVVPTLTKSEIVRTILEDHNGDQPPQPPPIQPPPVPVVVVNPVLGRPIGAPPAGWGHLVDDDDFSVPPPQVKPLLRLRRGELSSIPMERHLQLLLKE